jgi:uncharacterized membrane protein YbhN (UPF0104 family)
LVFPELPHFIYSKFEPVIGYNSAMIIPKLSQVRQKLQHPWVKKSTVIAILLLTIFVFIHFFATHHEYITSLKHVKPSVIVAVILLNFVMVALLVLLYDSILRLCGKRLKLKENILLTSYSSIANFFGPLQSGPGVRAAYLKSRHQLRIRDYTLATLIYYGMFAFFSALFLAIGSRPWWQTIGALLIVGGFSYFVIRLFMKRDKGKGAPSQFALRPKVLAVLLVTTFLQVVLTAVTYFVELQAVDKTVHFSQAITYAGAANFSLFVSLTPDAIGFRETFLVLSRNLHHISTSTILSANLIDRGAYLLFLGILFVIVLLVHAKDQLHIKKRSK